MLPQLVGRLRKGVLLFENTHERLRERPVEIGVPDHVPFVLAANAHGFDSFVRPGFNAPLFRRPFLVLHRIVCFPHILLERICREVIVRRTDVGVVENLFDHPKRRTVVARREIAVYHNMDTVLFFQVEEVLLLIPHDHDNVVYARFLQLLDLALYENFAANAQKPFGLFVGDRGKTRRQACCHDHGVLHAIRLQDRDARGRHAAFVDQSVVRQARKRFVHCTKGNVRRNSDIALGRPRRPKNGVEGLEFVLGQTHG